MKNRPERIALFIALGVVGLVMFSVVVRWYTCGFFSRFKEYPASNVAEEIEKRFGWQLPVDALQGRAARRRFPGKEEWLLTFQADEASLRRSFPPHREKMGEPLDNPFVHFAAHALGTIPPSAGMMPWWKPQVVAGGTGIEGGSDVNQDGNEYALSFLADTTNKNACVVSVAVDCYLDK